MSESTEQAAVVRWFNYQYPLHTIFSNNNANKLASRAKNRFSLFANLKREGMLPGVSDLFIAVPVSPYAGLFLEMKAKGKTLCSVKTEQMAFILDMKQAGYAAAWAAGAENAEALINQYMSGSLLEPY
jgi:hypothetical protein